ncbi:MAG: hypothetical protein V4660_12570 [Pseudomonadota bacterium]
MITFDRYPHINDLIQFYLSEVPDKHIERIIETGVTNEADAELFSAFVWQMVDRIHRDEEIEREVLGRADNSDMLPDLSYEITKYMRKTGFYSVWERISNLDE